MNYKKHKTIVRGNLIESEERVTEAVYIETRVARALAGEGDVDMVRAPIYTPREEDVPFECNPRTEKLDVLLDSINKVQDKYYEDRANRNKESVKDDKPVENSSDKGNNTETDG